MNQRQSGYDMVKELVKGGAKATAVFLVFPAACLALFGRFHGGFIFCAQALAYIPGLPGSYLRVAFYHLTLERCRLNSHIAVGSYFAHAQASVGGRVGIGANCVIGHVDIGDGAQIGPNVQILSGTNQHVRDVQGRLTDHGRVFRRLSIGPECWIGASSVIMADLGAQATVAPGSVVARDVPQAATVAGNPARLVRPALSYSTEAG